MNTGGGAAASVIAAARLRVARSRLSRSSALRCGVQRFSPIDAPARLITASAPSNRGRPRSGLSVRFPADAGNAGHAGARLVTRFAGRQPARQHADVVAVLGIRLGKRASEEPGTAGDHDLHR